MVQEIKLKVAEAIQDDVNKGIARIDSSFMQQAGIRPGDIVEIEGERITVAIADRAYPGDIGLNIIRMDGIIRRNAKTGIGELIKVRKALVKEARRVVISPAKKGISIRAASEVFKQGLLGRAAVKGDIVALGGTRRRRSSVMENPFFDDVFNILDESMLGFGFVDLKFLVADTSPKGNIIITDETEVEYNQEAVEIEDSEGVLEITYEDIGGLEEEVRKIREMVELPLKYPEVFDRLGIEAPKGVLLHGPPGTGKTLLAKAVANETNSHFIVINGPEIMSKYYGQSEENLRKKFEEAEKNAPSIMFIDEIDAIASKREETRGEVERRVVAQLLALMDGLKSRGKVVVIAATNVPNILDPALRRPGRFDREVEIGVPRKEGRLNILKIHTRNMPILTQPESLNKNYKSIKIVKELESIFKQIEINKLLTSIDKNVKSKEEFLLVSVDRFHATLKKYLSKTADRSTREFFDTSLRKIAEMIANEVMNYIFFDIQINDDTDGGRKEVKVIKLKEDADAKLSQRFADLKKEEGLRDLLSKIVKELILEDIANRTYGFVGADLAALAKESAMVVLRRILPDVKLDENDKLPMELINKLFITREDFYESLKVVRPSALREVLIDIPDVKWESIGGLDDVKQEIREAVEWPLMYPDAFKKMGVSPPKGVLLYGAPGTGKTLLAKAVASESQSNFILIKGPELLSKWVGESEKAVREIFKKARQTSPTIIFFDEIDSLAPRRGISSENHVTERVVNQFLTEIDGLEEMHDVVIIAATNRPDIVDPALLRPGRFDRIVLVTAPDEKGREEILNVHTKNMPIKNVDIKSLAKKMEGYVGADIESVCREAAILALRKDIKAKEITMNHFEEAIQKVPPSVTLEIEQIYKDLRNSFSSARARQMKEEKPVYMG